jgi:hypothetical protein
LVVFNKQLGSMGRLFWVLVIQSFGRAGAIRVIWGGFGFSGRFSGVMALWGKIGEGGFKGICLVSGAYREFSGVEAASRRQCFGLLV